MWHASGDPHREVPSVTGRGRRRARRYRAPLAFAALTLLVACGSPPNPDPPPGLSPFAPGVLLRAQVSENVTACEVDAVCYLVLQLSDTTIVAVYGTGERPAPPCPISTEVSDAAFGADAGDVVEVRVTNCEGEGYFINEIRPTRSEATTSGGVGR